MLLALALALLFPIADLNDDLAAAAKKGDAKAVEALLSKGADVNAKFRYGASSLSYACDRGNVEVVKVLLDHGADVNVKDTFYSATPLTWAAQRGHAEILKMLLAKGATGKETALMMGVSSKNTGVVKVVLEQPGWKPEALSGALATATRNKSDDIAELLKKAGAIPPPAASFQVDEETLKSYAGVYKSAEIPEFTLTVKDGKLTGGPSGQNVVLGALDKVTFRPLEIDGITLTFQLEEGRVTGFILKQGERTIIFKKGESK